ncbi:asparagine synthase (glutamine-hydrolyzing) [Sphingopyxis sp. XHP0097]|uniref:asparagine synthase (glutamine-hydrolyzing) n=1 Tax=Sphingopyxis jiangsuensis TaxID=2871171 RepID=A0ABS7MBN0_9SPHN|nr:MULTISPECIES: asparagine synthase (glutamine-hydrolyzing) [Sphingopyxis]MBL0768206.1 asparagine synthase (glutamine-hydrolyzing) [Sphingopyxis lutea]MBY4636079.1 asparagine synthase (glutamine-hydrolyzing) [Sphingopyxis jiangsuensis]
MCGFAGFLDRAGFADGEAVLRRMADTLVHRGPDSDGYWVDGEAGIALAHRRLAIMDLSPAGHQPMASHDGRFVLSYNGEIYNHLDLRRELEANGQIGWRGHSDTETLLQGFSAWGVPGTLDRVNGMFALALWDKGERKLFLARDRMGEKPLYYGLQGNTLLFGSELKALRQHPAWRAGVNRDALALFLRHNYVPGPGSIFEGIQKLPPAHYLEIGVNDVALPASVAYWDIAAKAKAGRDTPFSGSAQESVDALETLLLDAVGIRMAADVPLGAFLSGGYDSSTIVALMQHRSARPVKTFSIGFSEAEYDEAHHAKRVATHLGTDHTELYVTPQDALDQIPILPHHWDEPFADSSQIPTLLVSRLARSEVTVSLSGDGGDELFCGYTRYAQGYDIWRRLGRMPRGARTLAAAMLRMTPANLIDGAMKFAPERLRKMAVGDRMLKLADVLNVERADDFYRSLVSHAKNPSALVPGAHEPVTILTESDPDWPTDGDFRDRMMYLDMRSYLPDDILVKVDRASMAVSLESRVPLLDHRVVEFALALPLSYKLRGDEAKWPLRQLLYRYVPREMMERPKMGFGVPIEHWLRGPLRSWADDLLAPDRLRRDGYFDAEAVARLWSDTRSGRRRLHYHVWDVLMFQAWLDAQATR